VTIVYIQGDVICLFTYSAHGGTDEVITYLAKFKLLGHFQCRANCHTKLILGGLTFKLYITILLLSK